jgi:hypothetical protein|tara:strand:- start:219 stop:437 length:219 start_codon:yes stop_codon:yes gene_type:complete
MTTFFWGRMFSCNLRNGAGFDIEACDSRPVWISSDNFQGTKVASFDGIVLLLPFLIFTFGIIFEHEDNDEEF